MSEPVDCIIIGSGPAGLTAATYLERYRRKVLLLGSGPSRASFIARTRNIPGYPRGICGSSLLDALHGQVRQYGARLLPLRAQRISGRLGAYDLCAGAEFLRSRTVILCTGVEDRLPPSLQGQWSAVREGAVRLCPICDAFEFTGTPLSVLGGTEKTAREALFLCGYSKDVTLFTDGARSSRWSSDLQTLLRVHSVRIEERPIVRIRAESDSVTITLDSGAEQSARVLYVALGCRVRTGLATDLGAETDDEGFLKVDPHQQTTVPGLYAAGDVVQSLSQIAVAFGQAAIAATAVHNTLRESFQRSLLKQSPEDRAGSQDRLRVSL